MILTKLIGIDLNVKTVTGTDNSLTDCQLMIHIGVYGKKPVAGLVFANVSSDVADGGGGQRAWVFRFFGPYSLYHIC